MGTPEEIYRNLCSSETLRSGKKGFFRDFSEHTLQTIGEGWISKTFARLSNDEERITAIFTDKKIKDVVLETLCRVQPLFRDKDANIAKQRTAEGVAAATAGESERARLLFSQAILRAPTGKCKIPEVGGSTLFLALLGRAQLLAASQEYRLALEDLKRIEENSLPEASEAELLRLKEECERFLEKDENCSLLPLTACREALRREGKKGLLPVLTGGANSLYPNASSLIEIRESSGEGKRAVAAKSIEPGDVLVAEPPLASCLLPEYYGTHCHHCFSRLRAPVGCPHCSTVAFCGEICKDLATSSYHKYECKILALLIGSGMSILTMLALRMITQEGRKHCLRIYRALKEPEVAEADGPSATRARAPTTSSTAESVKSRGVSGRKGGPKQRRRCRRRQRRTTIEDAEEPQVDGVSSPERSENDPDVDLRAYRLVMHQTERSAKDFLERSLMAAFMLKCLQRVGFFENSTTDDGLLTEEEVAIGSLLLKNLQLLQFNAHEVFETRLGSEHLFRGSKPVYIGVAIYPTVARFNHDCYPAVTRYFVGQSIVIRATRSLQPGDVVAENYGPIFTKKSLEERQRTLAGRYWFRCACKACREDWPRLENLTNDTVHLRCPTKGCGQGHFRSKTSIVCSACKRKVDLEEAVARLGECERTYARGLMAMEEERAEEAVEILIKGAIDFHKIALPPHRDTHLAEIGLSASMADGGNTWRPFLP